MVQSYFEDMESGNRALPPAPEKKRARRKLGAGQSSHDGLLLLVTCTHIGSQSSPQSLVMQICAEVLVVSATNANAKRKTGLVTFGARFGCQADKSVRPVTEDIG